MLQATLRPLFGLLLLIPLWRRLRRRPAWKWVRAGGWAAGLALMLLSGGRPALTWTGVVVLALATMWGPAEDPDSTQKLADQLGARHVINGGALAAGDVDLPPGTSVLLFLTPEEALLAAAAKLDDVKLRFALAGVDEIAVEGQEYRPQYVSFAKAPPQREQNPDRRAKRRLTIRFSLPDGAAGRLDLDYRGAFAQHLAEIAAHTLLECRSLARQSLARQNAAPQTPAEFLRIKL
ncbi:MAG TPA: hypothetical protein VEU62_05840 [Bryobacterales bacterium]|nr:hypothetical protein [Bryobacterales bacterium]